MNRADYTKLLDEIADEISEPEGTFWASFGPKTEKEMEEIRYIAAIALFAADRFYSRLKVCSHITGRSIPLLAKRAFAN